MKIDEITKIDLERSIYIMGFIKGTLCALQKEEDGSEELLKYMDSVKLIIEAVAEYKDKNYK